MTTLFVGGPRHGTATDSDTPIYSDLLSGTQYQLEPASFTSAHPITGRPEWTYNIKIYVHQSIDDAFLCYVCNASVPANHGQTTEGAGHLANMVMQPRNVMLQQSTMDATLRAWFLNNGVRERAKQPKPPTPDQIEGNGAALQPEPPRVYTMHCPHCHPTRDWTFVSLSERGKAATEHRERTGHALDFDTEEVK